MILDDITCNDFDFILKIVAYLFRLLQWIIPVILILLITFDLFKVVTNGDEKAKKDAVGKAVKRILYAVILFLIPIVVKFSFRMINKTRPIDNDGNRVSTTDWISCFNEYFN